MSDLGDPQMGELVHAKPEDSFAGTPPTVAELRSSREHDGTLWSPRDALIAVLRDIDEGKIKVKNVAICLTVEDHDGSAGVATEHVAAYKNRLELLGTVIKTMNWVSGKEP